MTHLAKARALALGLPAALMAGALGSQYIGGLYPCEMCHWQRWPHDTAIVAALFAFGTRSQRAAYWLIWFAALAILTSGLIGAFHAGVEYGWWPGLTTCASTANGTTIEAIMNAPIVRCDVPQWTLFGISLAGFNALLSIGGALVILTLLSRRNGQA
jgi:disulfide bond formation protein DsbB